MTTNTNTSKPTGTMAQALIAWHKTKPVCPKNGSNPHFRSKYATLDDIIATITPVLAKHELNFTQRVIVVDGEDRLQTVLMHDSGQTITDEGVPILNAKGDAHGLGSGITYAKRYGLSAMLGIAADPDDDGNAAVKSAPKPIARATMKGNQ